MRLGDDDDHRLGICNPKQQPGHVLAATCSFDYGNLARHLVCVQECRAILARVGQGDLGIDGRHGLPSKVLSRIHDARTVRSDPNLGNVDGAVGGARRAGMVCKPTKPQESVVHNAWLRSAHRSKCRYRTSKKTGTMCEVRTPMCPGCCNLGEARRLPSFGGSDIKPRLWAAYAKRLIIMKLEPLVGIGSAPAAAVMGPW
jgi:hypothetical protein